MTDYEMEQDWPREMMYEYRQYREKLHEASYKTDDIIMACINKMQEIVNDVKKYNEAESTIKNLERKYGIQGGYSDI